MKAEREQEILCKVKQRYKDMFNRRIRKYADGLIDLYVNSNIKGYSRLFTKGKPYRLLLRNAKFKKQFSNKLAMHGIHNIFGNLLTH